MIKNLSYLTFVWLEILLSLNYLNADNILVKFVEVEFKNNTNLLLEIADTHQKRALGLMNREKLDRNSGMLFDYKSSHYVEIWMKNTLIPLDVIFLKNNQIKYIKHNALPCEESVVICPIIKAESPVDMVIEVNAGIAKAYDIEIGDFISIKR